jgi:hypothetical protein
LRRPGWKKTRIILMGLRVAKNNIILVTKEREEISEGMLVVEGIQSNRKILIALRWGRIITHLEKGEARKLSQLMI